jgi:dCMP deaminase
MSKKLSTSDIQYYLSIAETVASKSKDEQTKVGAVLISPTGRMIASGYNGFLRDAKDDLLPKVRPAKYEFMQHAERNILYNCLDEGIRSRDCIIVCTLSPCLECVRACYQAGIVQIIYKKLYFNSTDIYLTMPDLNVIVDASVPDFTILRLNPGSELSNGMVINRLKKEV